MLINNQPQDTNIIKPSDDFYLLGLTFDSKINFSKHIQTNTQGITEINCTPDSYQSGWTQRSGLTMAGSLSSASFDTALWSATSVDMMY